MASSSPPFLIVSALLLLSILALMRPRRFYIVRHGETLLNAQHIHQGADGGLSEKGRQQAERVGRKLKGLGIRRMLSSTYQRARETAAIINTYLKVPITYSSLLVERGNPNEIVEKPTNDPAVAHIIDLMDLAYHDDNYRFSNEENFADMKNRARKCLDLLARQGHSRTVVVTHHHFLKMVIAYLLYRNELHASDFVKLSFFNASDNAGITICDYHPWRMFSATRGWEVVSYNEQP